MITKILVEIIKRNKMKLKSATTGDNFRLAICFEFILSIFTTVAGSILTSNSNTYIMVFGIVILIYSMGSMISFFSVFFTLKSLWEWNGELTSKYYSTGTILKRDEDAILMQSTGLLDKDNKEIFDGDILAIETKDGLVKVIVFWDNEHALFMVESKTYNEKVALAELIEDDSPITIIGNIHENSALLEK